MSKIGNLVIQAQEDAVDGMTLPNFLEEYGGDSLWIWEEVNGEAPDEEEFRQKSFFGKSLEEQSDQEIQTEHWADDRRIRTSDF